MDAPAHHDPNLFDETGTIITDVACRRCAYNLRGLNSEGRCPECGTPVGRSTHGDFLEFSDPAWVETLHCGTRIILIGVLIGFILGVSGGCLSAVLNSPILNHACTLVASLISYYGAWLLTEPDPSRIGEDIYGTARRIVRISLAAGMVSIVIGAVIDSVSLPGIAMLLVVLLVVISGLFGIVGEYCRLYYLEKLAQRIPDPKLEQRARWLKWVLAIGLLFVMGFSFATMLIGLGVWSVTPGPATTGQLTLTTAPATAATPATPFPFGGAPAAIFAGAACAGSAVYLVALIMYLFLLYRLGKAFENKALIARSLWTGESAPPTPPSPPVET